MLVCCVYMLVLRGKRTRVSARGDVCRQKPSNSNDVLFQNPVLWWLCFSWHLVHGLNANAKFCTVQCCVL
jgi:hypothetical protein